MIITVTGHRPDKLVPNKRDAYAEKTFSRLVALATSCFKKLTPSEVITGMALGWDQAVAQACINMGISFTAAVPCLQHESRWLPESKQYYHELLGKAKETVVVYNGLYQQNPGCMQLRNEWMVDHCDHVLALWDGSKGGTGNCMKYVLECQLPYTNAWGSWVKYSGFFPTENI